MEEATNLSLPLDLPCTPLKSNEKKHPQVRINNKKCSAKCWHMSSRNANYCHCSLDHCIDCVCVGSGGKPQVFSQWRLSCKQKCDLRQIWPGSKMGQYCLLVGGWETDVGCFLNCHWPGMKEGLDVSHMNCPCPQV